MWLREHWSQRENNTCEEQGQRKPIKQLASATLIKCGQTEETSTTSPSSSTLGNLYRQARSEHYYASRYGTEGSSVSSSAIGIRGVPEHRDAAYYHWRQRTKYDPYDEDNETPMRHRDRYDDYNDRGKIGGYMYDRPKGPTLDYDRGRAPPSYDYDRVRAPAYDYDRYDPYGRNDFSKPLEYPDRYDFHMLRDRYNDMRYDTKYDRFAERGNGYDNLNQRHLLNGNRYDPYSSPSRRPLDDLYYSRYDRHNRYYPSRYDQYDRYDQYERSYYRRPYDDRYSPRGHDDTRGYYSSGAWAPGYERGYANTWNYAGGSRDNWREPERDRDSGYGDNWKDLNRDRDAGPYRPRDYFYDSTIPPGGSRGTSYPYDRAESSTKPDSTEREKPTSSPQTQDNNKGYKD
ncbi:hypothetical protein PV328_002445 [Microctonus aethiopoides]|uniref:Uncharacterized protein n=1 Tax=Microctonus aethiopoides TaxID=144406 RepID=A0AA39F6B3_9HYME|nr:hypothetical protein PV328_002445 [Microctonus aethiopoides]